MAEYQRNYRLPRPIMNPMIKHFKNRMRERNQMFVSEAMIQSIIKQYHDKSAKIVKHQNNGKLRMVCRINDRLIPIIFDPKASLPVTCFEEIKIN